MDIVSSIEDKLNMEHHQGNLTSTTFTEDKQKVKVQVELTPSPENVNSHHENNLLESICSENENTSITTSTSPYNAGLYTSALPYMTWNTGGQLTASPYLLSSQSTSLSHVLVFQPRQTYVGAPIHLCKMKKWRAAVAQKYKN
ncbi:hypothetical protein DPMN_004886 [Dreissena polymorpha]|uniref:Uncharacterized protein n=1 Tax=Dreissena polymorpha TaxID=45954 RepID=A0A9D4RTY2_DREPO|nr:hypothetical protein DPMN_004886 [Dreissena polymorpha]